MEGKQLSFIRSVCVIKSNLERILMGLRKGKEEIAY